MFTTIYNSIFKNWITSLFGAIAGLPQIVEGLMAKPKDWAKVYYGLTLLIAFLSAKDGRVTGGSIKQ